MLSGIQRPQISGCVRDHRPVVFFFWFQGISEVEILGNPTENGCFWGSFLGCQLIVSKKNTWQILGFESGESLPILPIFLSRIQRCLGCLVRCWSVSGVPVSYYIPYLNCFKHGLDAWLFVGCFKFRLQHLVVSFRTNLALLPALFCRVLCSHLIQSLWRRWKQMMYVWLRLKNLVKRRQLLNDAVELFIAICNNFWHVNVAVFGAPCLPTRRRKKTQTWQG